MDAAPQWRPDRVVSCSWLAAPDDVGFCHVAYGGGAEFASPLSLPVADKLSGDVSHFRALSHREGIQPHYVPRKSRLQDLPRPFGRSGELIDEGLAEGALKARARPLRENVGLEPHLFRLATGFDLRKYQSCFSFCRRASKGDFVETRDVGNIIPPAPGFKPLLKFLVGRILDRQIAEDQQAHLLDDPLP